MGNGMNKIIPGLWLGSIRDSNDKEQLEQNKITHILAIHDHPKQDNGIQNIKYLRFKLPDNAQANIKQFFDESISFIHEARLGGGNVLVHCLAGVSRSASVCTAYVMTVTGFPWYDSMNAIRAAREQANPNFGFQRQLQNFEHTTVKKTREALYSMYGDYDNSEDVKIARELLAKYKTEQKRIEDLNSESMKNNKGYQYNPKQYPLPFNKYNIDDNKEIKSTKAASTSEITNTSQQLTPEQLASEKDQIVKKLFG